MQESNPNTRSSHSTQGPPPGSSARIATWEKIGFRMMVVGGLVAGVGGLSGVAPVGAVGLTVFAGGVVAGVVAKIKNYRFIKQTEARLQEKEWAETIEDPTTAAQPHDGIIQGYSPGQVSEESVSHGLPPDPEQVVLGDEVPVSERGGLSSDKNLPVEGVPVASGRTRGGDES